MGKALAARQNVDPRQPPGETHPVSRRMPRLRLPPPIRFALETLRLDREILQSPAAPPADEAAWRQALDFTDREQLTLALHAKLVENSLWNAAPHSIRERLARNLADNTERLARIRAEAAAVAARLAASGVEFVTLKGLSHVPHFVADARRRVQYDVDLYCPPETVPQAQEVLLAMGYEPISSLEAFPTDHLPTLVRKTGWQWRGNYFDRDLPVAVDLHFRLWDAETERLPAPGLEEFWARRADRELDLADRIGYAALHALRHLLRGSLRIHQIFEIAQFLENRKGDLAFWKRWRELHPPELRKLESISFRLAAEYFGAPAVEIGATLPADAECWFARYAWSPVEALFKPNKHELYLHLSLLIGRSDRWAVIKRRLAPLSWPGPVDAVHVPDGEETAAMRLRKWARYAAFAGSRITHHARVMIPTLWGLATWRRDWGDSSQA